MKQLKCDSGRVDDFHTALAKLSLEALTAAQFEVMKLVLETEPFAFAIQIDPAIEAVEVVKQRLLRLKATNP